MRTRWVHITCPRCTAMFTTEVLDGMDEAMMEAAKKVRDAVLLHVLALRILGPVAKEQLGEAGFDDAALARIIDLTPALETTSAEEGE